MKLSIMPKTKITWDDSLATPQNQSRSAALIMSQAYIGYRLGLYQALSGGESLTAFEIAIWTDTDETFVHEWLELQAQAGLLSLENPEAAPTARRFRLDPTQAKTVAKWHNLAYRPLLADPTAEILHPGEVRHDG